MSGAPTSLDADTALVRPVWSILAKGFTGTGKTIASCGKEFRPVYVFMCEGRLESVLTYYRKLDGNVKGIHYNDYTMESGFYPLNQKMDAIIARPEYRTVVVSSLTSYIRIVLNHLIRSTPRREDGKTGGKNKGGIQVNTMEDYNYEDAAIINELIAFFQQLKSDGVNVILEAHITPYEAKAGDDIKTVYEILTKGKKAPAEIPSWFNEVWLFEKIIEGWDPSKATGRFMINPFGNPTTSCKTSFGITPFDWTGTDSSTRLMSFLSQEIQNTPAKDPNAPTKASW